METILVCDDDKQITELLKAYLKKEGFQVKAVNTGKELIHLVEQTEANAIILDINLEDMSGFEVMRKMGERSLPIILLTGRTDLVDKLVGLEIGADDYITKPFDLRELSLRLKAILRRIEKRNSINELVITYEDLQIDMKGMTVVLANNPINLTQKEFQILM